MSPAAADFSALDLLALDPRALAAIALMALATMATRLAGLVLPADFARRGRLKRAFDAVPPAVLAALIAPAAFGNGWPERVAAVACLAAAALRLPMLAIVVLGVGITALGRQFG